MKPKERGKSREIEMEMVLAEEILTKQSKQMQYPGVSVVGEQKPMKMEKESARNRF